MAALKYTVIKNREQYNAYCNALETLLRKPEQTADVSDEAELLTTLIEVWDRQHSQTAPLDPIQLLRGFVKEHKLKPAEVMAIMGITSRGHLYEILNYQKGLSKQVIRNLAAYFKVSQEAFNRHYSLKQSSMKAAKKSVKKLNAGTKAKRSKGKKIRSSKNSFQAA